MTLITTSGAANADSYFTLDEATVYFTSRGIAAWTGTDAVLEAKARLGTAYLDNQYRGRWIGIAVAQTQALSWPRVDGYRTLYRSMTYPLLGPEGFLITDSMVPIQVKQAAMEAALMALASVVLEPSLSRGGQIKSLSQGVGPLSETTVWQDGAPAVDRYLVVEGLLRGLVTSTPGASNGNARVVRS